MAISLPSSRLFTCARCKKQTRICTFCDTGHIYCSDSCRINRVRKSWRECSARYQSTFKGKKKHAARQARYHAGKKKMTHASSHKVPDPLSPVETTAANPTIMAAERKETTGEPNPEPNPEHPSLNHPQQTRPGVRCDFCGRPCSEFTRLGPLRKKRRKQQRSPRQPVFEKRSNRPQPNPRL